jgi:hypothetical protein
MIYLLLLWPDWSQIRGRAIEWLADDVGSGHQTSLGGRIYARRAVPAARRRSLTGSAASETSGE